MWRMCKSGAGGSSRAILLHAAGWAGSRRAEGGARGGAGTGITMWGALIVTLKPGGPKSVPKTKGGCSRWEQLANRLRRVGVRVAGAVVFAIAAEHGGLDSRVLEEHRSCN